jgi:poly(3-hydroxybutyrate) depolymerase
MPLQTLNHATPEGERLVYIWQPLGDVQPTLGIFLLHPTGGSSTGSLRSGRWLEQEGLAVCAPQALGFNPELPAGPDNPRAWSSYGGPMVNRTLDDASYLLELAAEFKRSLPTGTPLCLVGHSNGCAIGFNCLLARDEHPFDMAAFYAANWAHPRDAVKRIPLLYMVGDADPIYPWAQNTPVNTPWFSYETVRAQVSVEAWLAATGLPSAPAVAEVDSLAGRYQRWQAQDGLVFEFRVLPGQGHHWPAGLPLDSKLQAVLGPNNESLSATELSLAFFENHRQWVRTQSLASVPA